MGKYTQPKFSESTPPQTILRWAVDTYQDNLVVVTSFQNTGLVTLHMLREIAPELPVITLDTGKLFPETIAFINEIEINWHLNLHRARPQPYITVDEHTPDTCCRLRKVEPLRVALGPYAAWLTGVRRDQAATRAHTPFVGTDNAGRVKIAPFTAWTSAMIAAYIAAHRIPTNPLYQQGYTSIGCAPCTRPVRPDEHPRAGRWDGTAKTECGIHQPTPPA